MVKWYTAYNPHTKEACGITTSKGDYSHDKRLINAFLWKSYGVMEFGESDEFHDRIYNDGGVEIDSSSHLFSFGVTDYEAFKELYIGDAYSIPTHSIYELIIIYNEQKITP